MRKLPKTRFALISVLILLSVIPIKILNADINNINKIISKLNIKKVVSCLKPIKEFPDYSLAIITKDFELPVDYVPDDLINISEIVKTKGAACLKKETAGNLIKMFFDAREEGVNLSIISGFREASIQRKIYYYWLGKLGPKAKFLVAPPSSSEHQLGTTVDLSGKSLNYQSPFYADFNETPEGQWLFNNAYRYGFIMSYPKEKEEITGYKYEPWHYRYIGRQIAVELMTKGFVYNEILKILLRDTTLSQ